MTHVAPFPHATSQPGRAAGIGAVAFDVLIAVAVAVLFLGLIGADRCGQASHLITTARRPLTACARTTPTRPERKETMNSKYVWALLLALIGLAAYGAVVSATPPSGLSNPPWSPIIGHFAGGIDATAKTDVNPASAKDFWRTRIQAKGATDVQILENVIHPGGTFGWHSHPGPSLVVVQSGTLSVYHAPDCKPQDFGPTFPLGSTFVDGGMTSTWCATTTRASTRTSTSSRSSRRASSVGSTSRTRTRASAPTELARMPLRDAYGDRRSSRC